MSDDVRSPELFSGVDASAAIQRVLDAWLRETGNPTTAKSKQYDLGCLAAFLGLSSDADGLRQAATRLLVHGFGDAQDLARQWLDWMAEEGFSANTRARRLSHIRGLVRKAGEFGLRWQLRIRGPSARVSREVTGPEPDLVYQRIRALASMNDPRSIRDCAILIVFITLGVRRQAVVQLRLEDYQCGDSEHSTLRSKQDTLGASLALVGKTEQEKHTRSLPEVAAIAIERWLEARGDRPGHLFCSIRALSGEAPELPSLAPSSIYRLCQHHGLGRPHGLRHSSATKLARDGHDVWELKAHLRHKTTDTVNVYVDQAENVPGKTAAHLAGPLEGLFDSST